MVRTSVGATIGTSMFVAAALVSEPAGICAGDPQNTPPADASVVNLMTRELISGPEKEVVMLTVTYPAAGASLPHRHDAQVFVYVLEGELKMQVRGSPVVTLRPGETFYEAPDDVHVVSANASKTNRAKILVVMIKDKGKPGSRTVNQ
jgi:quercetin dioxygenase-like cupin family protein